MKPLSAFGRGVCGTAVCSANRAPGEPLRFTGKERDAETGLDYFGARYYRANTGRFTTVDPVMNTKASLVDPQRWNRYAYAKNNPLRFVDPDGRYTCSGADCGKIESARQASLRSSNADVRRGAGAYGDPGVDNGVTVSFGDPGAGRAGNTTHGLEASGDGVRVTAGVTIGKGLRGTSLQEVVAHEGSHVADSQDFGATIQGAAYDASKNLTSYDTEFLAYQVSNAVLASANEKAGFGKCDSGPCILGAGVAPSVVNSTINRFLANPANGYGGVTPDKPGPRLFPSLP